MQMSDHELLYEYRHAVNRKAQIGVLADLNAVSVAVMHQKLEMLGAEDLPPLRDIPAPIALRQTVHIDEDRAMQLYNAGMCDLDMAEALGVGRKAVADWRQKHNLKIHRQKPTTRTSETISYMKVSGLLRIAKKAFDAAPETAIVVSGKRVKDARVCFSYNEGGEIVGAELELVLIEEDAQ